MPGKINVDEDNAVQILDYWFVMEFLNQQSLRKYNDIRNETFAYKKELKNGYIKRPKKVVENFVPFKKGDNLHTLLQADSDAMKLPLWSDFTVFVGCMKKEVCIQKIAQNVEWRGQSPDENFDEIALATLKFSKNGSYITNSLAISPVAWAMKKISGGVVNASEKLSISEYKAEIRSVEEQISRLFEPIEEGDSFLESPSKFPVSDVVSYDLLRKIEEMICKDLQISVADTNGSFLAVYFKLYASEKDVEEDEDEIGFHMDFYSEDLEMAAKGLRNNSFSEAKKKLLLDYILGLYRYGGDSEKKPKRFDVVKPNSEEELYQFMLTTLTAEKAPLGKWPSRFMPTLMQQIAVNLATDKENILPVFSVNGPPGTGKTTLLKEIIVSNIVEKAILLADYKDPDEAFDDYNFEHGDGPEHSYNKFVKKYHRLKNKDINKYSVLVASSNNTAVENITKELPVEQKILDDITPSEKKEGPNNAALTELTKLFTVAESIETIPFKNTVWEEYTNEKGEKKKRSKEVVKEEPDIYFSRLATDLLNGRDGSRQKQQAFGLISASLGKKTNIKQVASKIISPLLEIMKKNEDITARKQSYVATRKMFKEQLSLVQKLRSELDKLVREEQKFVNICSEAENKKRQAEVIWRKQNLQSSEIDDEILIHRESISTFECEKTTIEMQINDIRTIVTELETKIKAQQSNIAATQTRIETLQKGVSRVGKFFKTTKYKETEGEILRTSEMQYQYLCQMNDLNKKLEEENEKITSSQTEIKNFEVKISEERKKLKELQIKRTNIEEERKRIEQELISANDKIDRQKSRVEKIKVDYQNKSPYERGFALNQQFIKDVFSVDIDVSTKAQLRNPWLSDRYNREREKLFLYALQMTKEFILGSKKCRDNFKHLDCLWNGSYSGGEQIKFVYDDLQECTAATYETLFLLIPVVSSTFASIQRLFKNTKEEDIIGTLIVDEAGQASPHMAIGALCRARRAVIVGDPKQVEPIVTDDQDLLRQTYAEDMFKLYADKTNSVQRFADIMNPYGTYLENGQGVEEWVGCPLLVHRRCIAPMYDISNDISYNNIMKQQTAQPKPEKLTTFIAAQSQWINISGKEAGRKSHFVKEQGDEVIKMLEIACSKNPYPDLFVISPFATVVSGVKAYIKKYIKVSKSRGEDNYLVKYESSVTGWMKKNIGTVHRFQGKEASEVIFLLGCDTSANAAMAIRWVNNNIVNVAVTRAKYRIYIIGDIQAWKDSKCVSRAKEIIDTYAFENLEHELQKENSDKEKLKKLCAEIPTGSTFPVFYKQGENEDEAEYIPSTAEVIREFTKANFMCRELTSEELSRFGFSSMEEVMKFSTKIRSNLLWGIKLYLLLEDAYKQTNAEIDASCCGILFCKAIEIQMQECFVDALKHHFPEYQMRVIPAVDFQDEQIIYLKDADTEEFTLGWYPAFIKKKKNELGIIMNRIGYAAYDKQWWDDFKSKLFECKNKRNDCCHTRLFQWENLETLLETMFAISESKHHNKLEGLMFESRVGLLMKENTDERVESETFFVK